MEHSKYIREKNEIPKELYEIVMNAFNNNHKINAEKLDKFVKTFKMWSPLPFKRNGARRQRKD